MLAAQVEDELKRLKELPPPPPAPAPARKQSMKPYAVAHPTRSHQRLHPLNSMLILCDFGLLLTSMRTRPMPQLTPVDRSLCGR
eukprot:6216329-Prymnesium_polylepis.2